MQYEIVILELLTRIKKLEEEVNKIFDKAKTIRLIFF